MKRREELTELWKRKGMVHRATGFLKAVSECRTKGSSMNARLWCLFSCSSARSRLWKTMEYCAVLPREKDFGHGLEQQNKGE